MEKTNVAQAVSEAVSGEEKSVEELTAEWSEIDREWLTHIPPNLQRIAVRHGRKCFAQVLMRGSCQHAVGILARQTRGNAACAKAGEMLTNAFTTLMQQLNAAWGLTEGQLQECDLDIQRFAALAQQAASTPKEGDRVSPGGIILNS